MSIIVNQNNYSGIKLTEQSDPDDPKVGSGTNLIYVSDGTVNGSIGDLRMKIADSDSSAVVDRLISARIPYIKSVYTTTSDLNWNADTTVNILNIDLTPGTWMIWGSIGASSNTGVGGYFWLTDVSSSSKTSLDYQTVAFYTGDLRGVANVTTIDEISTDTTIYFNACLDSGAYTGAMIDYSIGSGKTNPDAGAVLWAIRLI